MVSSHRLLLLAALQALALASFVPLPLHHFEQGPPKTGVRRFSHEEHHLMEGGTTLRMRWSADADPDSILGLDTERESGVKIASCSPTQLVIHLPASHVALAKAWKHVVASDRIHGCTHLQDSPLYHRVNHMEFTKHRDTPKGGKTAVFTTTELYTVAQVLPNVDFSYDVVPIDSLHPNKQEQARKYYDDLRWADVSARRLSNPLFNTTNSLNPQGGLGSPFAFDKTEWRSTVNGFAKGFHKSIGQVTVTNSMGIKDEAKYHEAVENWKPMTHANFGWNWNYHTNATRNPQFKYTLPGMKGYILLKNPYLKFIGKCKIAFKSHWDEINPFAKPPKVKFEAKLEGNAYVNADLSLMADIYRDVSEDPFGRFHIPLLNNFTRETHFFNKVHFFIANIPISLQPGVSVNLNAYHLGLFKGAVRVGVNTHLRIKAKVKYDSTEDKAVKAELKAQALNVRILPPTWMIYTKHLEFGALLTPAFWVKGGIGPVKDVTLELQLRPYCNVSITQEGQEVYGVQQQVMEKELVVMPFRAINLDLGSEWSVGIEANGRRKMTSTELSLGVVEFHDYVEHFRFGLIDQRKLLKDPIYVALFRNGVRQEGRIVPVYCESVVDGECNPAPFNAEFVIGMKTVIVQLTLAWHAKPVHYLMSKVRAISFVFPQLALSHDASEDYLRDPPQDLFIKITRNGREYRAYQNVTVVHDKLVVIDSRQTQDLGIEWIDAWRIKYGSIAGQQAVTNLIDPSVELWYTRHGREERIAQTFLPSIDWDAILIRRNDMGKLANNQGVHFGRNPDDTGVGRLGSSSYGGVVGRGRPWTGQEREEVTYRTNPHSVFRGGWNGAKSCRHHNLNGGGRRRHGQHLLCRLARGFFEGNVPLRIGLTTPNNQNWASGHMGLDVRNPETASRWLRPYRTDHFLTGSHHVLYWHTRHSDPSTPQSFKFAAFKVDPASGVYQPTHLQVQLPMQVCTYNDPEAKRFEGYGDECVYSKKLAVDDSLLGTTLVFQLVFTDHLDGTKHKMMSAPVRVVNQLPGENQNTWQSRVVSYPTGMRPQRRLMEEGGNMVDAPKDGDAAVNEIPMATLPVQPTDEEELEGKEEEKDDRHTDEVHVSLRNLQGVADADAIGNEVFGSEDTSEDENIGYETSDIDFGARMADLHPICSRKPLHYSLGAGLFLRAQLHNFQIPDGSPLGALAPLANLASFADMDTMDVPLVNTELGKKLSSLLPKDFCNEGVCDGNLPGCPGQVVHPMTIPKVEFKLKRKLKWNKDTEQSARDATAYAMALLPEFIRVVSIVIGSLMHHSTTLRPYRHNRYYHTGSVAYVNGQPCRWTRNPDCQAVFNYRGMDYYGCTTEDHGTRGWCSVDRKFQGNWHNCYLTCKNKYGQSYNIHDFKHVNIQTAPATRTGPMGQQSGGGFIDKLKNIFTGGRRLSEKKEEDAPETDRFLVDFQKEGLQYKVDKALIHTLLKRGAFRGIEDGRERRLGTADITHFRLHYGDYEPSEDDSKMIPVGAEQKFEVDMSGKDAEFGAEWSSPPISLKAPVNVPFITMIAGAAVLGVAGLVAGVYRVKNSNGQVAPYVTVDESEAHAEE
jgi:hypothetical protein